MGYYHGTLMFLFQWLNSGAFVGIAYYSSKSVQDGELTPGEVMAFLLYNW